MAITKTNIYYADYTANATALYKFLLSHAVPEYFDNVVLSDDSSTVSCFVGDLEFLKISIPLYVDSSTVTFAVSTTANKTWSTHINGSNYSYLQYAYKCKNGIALKIMNVGQFTISIVKNNEGKTAVIFPASNYSTNYQLLMHAFTAITSDNPTNRIYVIDVDSEEFGYISGDMKTGNNLTGIVPLPVTDNGCRYTPDAYLIAYSQTAAEGVLELNGVKYLSNGQWCIKDE